MMKPLMIGVLSLAMAAPAAASAQSWRGGDRDGDGRYERWERRADRNHWDGGRYTEHERLHDRQRRRHDQWHDRRDGPPYGNAWGYHRRWQRGAVIPHDHRGQWYVQDYHRYGWPPPPRGYGYYRTDTGDVLVATLATGVILSLFND